MSDTLFDALETMLRLAQYKEDKNGIPQCGLRDICDNLKNLLLVVGLLAAALAAVLGSHDNVVAQSARPEIFGYLALPALTLLFLGLLRQAYFVVSHLPGLRPADSLPYRPLLIALVALVYLGLAIGLLGLGLVSIIKYISVNH